MRMRIEPLTNANMVLRYRKQANTVIDSLTNQTLLTNNNEKKLDKFIKKLNKLGYLNASIIDNNPNVRQPKLLYVLV
jgi:hypothetical protein